ncbi:MAG: cardiolipin synthase [Desulfobacteraceae bacterium]|jgi:cardiolipin synthase
MEILLSPVKYYHYILLLANIIITFLLAWHALLYKRDPKASLGWLAVILMFPVFGCLFYFLFGINRIRTRARKLTGKTPFSGFIGFESIEEYTALPDPHLPVPIEYNKIANIVNFVTGIPLTSGNRIDIFHNGEAAYPAMLDAIDKAEHSIFFSTYIFKTDHMGRQFIDKLASARERGVEVKVILDGIGEYYSLPRAGSLLKKRGVEVSRFIPPALIPPSIHINLRNHRKILVVDKKAGFTGGMNIGSYNLADNLLNKSRVIDTHFRIQGPVVSQILKVFIDDWNFINDKDIEVVPPEDAYDTSGAKCRVISEGPNEDFNKLATILAGAIASASKRVLIMTPYFLPVREMISALQTAALKGVAVDILLPQKNNLPYVHWATRNMLWELLQRGVNVYYQPPPFVHTKLFVVDEYYAQIGTANMDSRSLRLNFELSLEVYDREFVSLLSEHIIKCRDQSKKITLAEIDSRHMLIRTRDAIAWLLYPYL